MRDYKDVVFIFIMTGLVYIGIQIATNIVAGIILGIALFYFNLKIGEKYIENDKQYYIELITNLLLTITILGGWIYYPIQMVVIAGLTIVVLLLNNYFHREAVVKNE